MNKGVTVIYDGNNTVIRNNAVTELYHAGIRTSGIHGTLTQILSDLKELQKGNILKNVIFAWDGGNTKRRAIYPEYKAQRKTKKDDNPHFYEELFFQMKTLQEFLPKIGIYSIKIKDWEADDVMYRLSRELDTNCVIVTTDKDLLQCVNETTAVYNPTKKVLHTHKNFTILTGLTPQQLVEYKVLVGDKSDNIGGIPGIGDKKARDLLGKYGCIAQAIVSKDPAISKSKVLSQIATPEGLQVIRRNVKLVDLSKMKSEELIAPIRDILDEEIFYNQSELIKFAQQYGLAQTLINSKSWTNTMNLIER